MTDACRSETCVGGNSCVMLHVAVMQGQLSKYSDLTSISVSILFRFRHVPTEADYIEGLAGRQSFIFAQLQLKIQLLARPRLICAILAARSALFDALHGATSTNLLSQSCGGHHRSGFQSSGEGYVQLEELATQLWMQ